MSMNTLKAAHDLQSAGFETAKAEAIARAINDFGRADLVSKDDLDMRMWQQTAAIIGANIAVIGLFKLFA